MSQNVKSFTTGIITTTANNLSLFIGDVETIILNDVNVFGTTNFALMIKNQSAFGTIIDVTAYGSQNGVDFYIIQDNLYPNSILPGTVGYSNFFGLTTTLRITAIANIADTQIDVYLQASTM
jgi:hypothetical protein